MSKSVKYIMIFLCLVNVGLIAYIVADKIADRERSNVVNTVNTMQNMGNGVGVENVVNTSINNEVTNSTNNSTEKNKNKEMKKITISNEEILDILLDTEPFDDVSNLSVDRKLEIVYHALNEGKIAAYKSRNNGSASVEYTEGEINGVIYSLFGVELEQNKSYGESLIYSDGKYTLKHSDRGSVTPVAKNIQSDVAAGTSYTEYDLYNVENGAETLVGHYLIAKSNVTSFVRKKTKM